MFKYAWILGIYLVSGPLYAQPVSCEVAKNTTLQLMGSELMRNFKVLKKQKPPIYYLSYRYNEMDITTVSASLNGVSATQGKNNNLAVVARAGSPQLDNTRALKGEKQQFDTAYIKFIALPQEQQPRAFRLALWRTTQKAAEDAQKQYSQVVAHSRTMTQGSDPSADFVFPPKETFCQLEQAKKIDLEQVKQLVQKAQQLPQGKPYVLNYAISFTYQYTQSYFVDSRGTRLAFPNHMMYLTYSINNRTQDGMELSRFKDYTVSSVEELPSQEQLLGDISKSLQELEALSKAPIGQPTTAPAILTGAATGVFVHEVLGHRLEGYRQKDESQGQTFAGKIGQRVVSPILTIVDDPTMTHFKATALKAHYLYDDEGVKARPVTLVENGVLKNFLMSSSPIAGFPVSNGHGRLNGGRRAVARMGIMHTKASQTVSYGELEKMLLEEIKKQGKPYGFIIEDLGGGYTLTGKSLPQTFKLETKLVWRVYPDGRKEMVRGLDIVGTPLVSFNKVLAASDDEAVFNGFCGSVSGWVAQANIAPSILLESLETELTQTSPWKPPLLPAPILEKGGKQ